MRDRWSSGGLVALVASTATGCFREVVAYDQTSATAQHIATILLERDIETEVLEQGTSRHPCFVVSVDPSDTVMAYAVLVEHNLPQGQPECASRAAGED
jgi:type III secretory pathway lipoprotein EscJ